MSLNRLLVVVSLGTFLAFALPNVSLAQKGEPAPAFKVVQTGDQFEVMPASAVKAFKKTKAQEFAGSVTAWKAAKKEAAKKKEKFSEPRPKKARVKVHGKTFKTEVLAQAYVKKLEEKAAKKKRKS